VPAIYTPVDINCVIVSVADCRGISFGCCVLCVVEFTVDESLNDFQSALPKAATQHSCCHFQWTNEVSPQKIARSLYGHTLNKFLIKRNFIRVHCYPLSWVTLGLFESNKNKNSLANRSDTITIVDKKGSPWIFFWSAQVS
jgi:hypothetical protein